MCYRICSFVVLITGFCSANCIGGIIDGFDVARHARFLEDGTANPDFFLDETQLSGVAHQRAALISPRHYVTANHVSTTSATFVGLDGIERTYTASSSQRLTTFVDGEGDIPSDIRVYRLDQEVDPAIMPLPIVVGEASDFIGQELIAFEQHQWAGRNTIDALGIVEFTSGSSDTVAVQYSFDTATNGGSGGLGQDEIGLLSGDSGGTALMSVGGRYGVLGTHMGIDVPEGSNAAAGDRYDTFSTLLAGYEGQLSSILAADGYSLQTLRVTAIPEPSAFAGCMLLSTVIVLRRHKRRRARSTGCPTAHSVSNHKFD